MSDAFKIEGLEDLDITLAALSERMGKSAMERAGRRGLAPFLAVVRDIAPTDDPAGTPDRPAYALRDSYIISTKLNKSQERSVRKAGKSYVEVYAGTNDPVGLWQEFGSIAFGKFWNPPQPHVSVAWNVTAGDVLGETIVAMREELDIALTRSVRRS